MSFRSRRGKRNRATGNNKGTIGTGTEKKPDFQAPGPQFPVLLVLLGPILIPLYTVHIHCTRTLYKWHCTLTLYIFNPNCAKILYSRVSSRVYSVQCSNPNQTRHIQITVQIGQKSVLHSPHGTLFLFWPKPNQFRQFWCQMIA